MQDWLIPSRLEVPMQAHVEMAPRSLSQSTTVQLYQATQIIEIMVVFIDINYTTM
jgi:hypothetical protein